MTTFTDLLMEVRNRDSWMLADARVGQYQQRRLIVQRRDGWIYEAWDAFSNDEAQPWSLVQMEYAYLHRWRLFPDGSGLDYVALWDALERLYAVDEAQRALARARAS